MHFKMVQALEMLCLNIGLIWFFELGANLSAQVLSSKSLQYRAGGVTLTILFCSISSNCSCFVRTSHVAFDLTKEFLRVKDLVFSACYLEANTQGQSAYTMMWSILDIEAAYPIQPHLDPI